MRRTYPHSTNLLPILVAATLLHAQIASAAGCDVPMFAGARLFGTAPGAQMAVTADFNHDGFVDLVVANGASNSISILLGNGDGTFQPAVNYPVSSNPTWVGVADFNGDGKPDLAIATNSGTAIMLGKGDGTFQTGTATSAIRVAGIGDFNNDGKPDLTDGLGISLGKGDGTFEAVVRNSGLLAIVTVAVGDVNGDGKLDVVGTDPAGGGIAVLLGDGKGGLGTPAEISTATSFFPNYVALVDLNGDHKLDVVAYDNVGNTFSVLLGNGNGTFQPAAHYALSGTGPNSANMVVADLNGDGIPDLAQAALPDLNNASGTGTLNVYAGVGDGTFLQPVVYQPTMQSYWWLGTADFNGDGKADLYFTYNVSASALVQVGVMLGNPDGTLQSSHRYIAGDIPRSPVLADLNGDSIPDLVIANAGLSGNISVLLGNGDGSFQTPVNYAAGFGVKSIAVGDLNGDGKPDLVVGNFSGGSILVYLGNGDGTFQDPRRTGVFPGVGGYVALGDFNNDGKLDVAALGIGVSILLGNGDGTFRSGGSYGPSLINQPAGQIMVGDLNGDSNLDLVVPAGDLEGLNPLNGGVVYVMLGNGDGTFRTYTQYTIGVAASSVAIGDLNGDGKPELVVTDLGDPNKNPAGAVAVLLNNGDGTFQSPVRYKVAAKGAAGVVIADFNGDGNPDVAAASSADETITILLGKGDGTFRNQSIYPSGIGSLAITAGDLSGDGKLDLVFVNDIANFAGLSSSVTVLLNSYVPTGNAACTPVTPLAN